MVSIGGGVVEKFQKPDFGRVVVSCRSKLDVVVVVGDFLMECFHVFSKCISRDTMCNYLCPLLIFSVSLNSA